MSDEKEDEKPKTKDPGRVEKRINKMGDKLDEIDAFIRTKKEIEGTAEKEEEREREKIQDELEEKAPDDSKDEDKAEPGSVASIFE